MKLSLDGMKNRQPWEHAGIHLPEYDIEAVRRETLTHPRWVHLGIGNIFRIFLGSIADRLIESGEMQTGITCVETFDFEVVDRIYRPYDNLALAVTLYGDGTSDKSVIGSLSEAIAANHADARERLREIFTDSGLQMVSFTITEKGYALRDMSGAYFPYIQRDLEQGPGDTGSAMPLIVSLLLDRYLAGGAPITLVSMDNVSGNGDKLKKAVLEIAGEWNQRGFADDGFLSWLQDKDRVAFPLTMIDKITPRPSESTRDMLTELGVENMEIVVTQKGTYIAPYVNAESAQYLVVEDTFPNGRPPFEKAGVYMTDRDTVSASERMKVTVCLNPLHTALAPYGCVLGYERFSDVMQDPELQRLVRMVGEEGMEVVHDPGILSPRAFMEECINVRFPNAYIPDTPQRIVVDTSQMLGIRFGETIKEYVRKYGNAARLHGIPLAIAGWLRYLLAVDDQGHAYALSPDPMNEVLQQMLSGIQIGKPETCQDQLKPILSNASIFGSDLYQVGLGERIEHLFREEIASFGAVRKTLCAELETQQK